MNFLPFDLTPLPLSVDTLPASVRIQPQKSQAELGDLQRSKDQGARRNTERISTERIKGASA